MEKKIREIFENEASAIRNIPVTENYVKAVEIIYDHVHRKDGKLVTPSIESGCLPGITRNTVLELAESLHIPAEQRNVAPEELIRSDEAFLTNSVMEIVPLTYIDNKQIGSDRKGEVTSSLIEAYKELVAAESSSLP